nr:retrovirus-related Pol polyprotein from transposon TNT 1-94 [Tanacetum cinerariifolium]
MNQTQRANNSIKNDSLAALYGKYHYKEDVVEDNRTSNEFMADLNAEYHERALLANLKRFYKRSGKRIDELTKGKDDKGMDDKRKSDKGLVAKSFDWDDESVSSEDEGTIKFKAFMAIDEDEPSVGKGDARSGQWVEITMKKVHRLLSMTEGDDRKQDYPHVDLLYVEDQRKNDEPSVGKGDARSSQWIEITMKKVHILLSMTDNEEQKHVLDYTYVDLQYVEVQINNLVNKNIVKALGGKGRRKENSKVLFTKADVSTSEPAPIITSDFEDDSDNQATQKDMAQLTVMESHSPRTEGSILNEKNEVVLIAPRTRDVYVIDMPSYNTDKNACFYAKASA